jgi:beta-fructofuranosidase
LVVLQLAETWTWDFWIADTGDEYHIYFLKASKVYHSPDGRKDLVRNPDGRHTRTTIGHAVSTDLFNWKVCDDVMAPSEEEAFDDLATWTGSVVKGPDGLWYMFYTGISYREGGLVQRIGLATSDDLYRWEKRSDFPPLAADARLYEKLGESTWPNETWRDPWVFPDPEGTGWHMFVTARAKTGADDDRGVVGHAYSLDLLNWEILPPLSESGAGFGDLEVTQISVIDGRPVLLFSCLNREFSIARRSAGETGGGSGGVWAVPSESILGPFDIYDAKLITDDKLYAGRMIQNRESQWLFLAFANDDAEGNFVGHLADPMSVTWQADGTLALKAMAGPQLV